MSTASRRGCAMLARAAATVLAAALLSTGAAEAGLPPEVTLHRPSISWFFMDYDGGDSVPDRTVAYGLPGDVGLLADVDGDTLSDLIVYRGGSWFVDLRNDAVHDININLGGPGDIPVAADFLGLGRAGIGVYRPGNGTWYLDQDADGVLDHISVFGGGPGDQPVVADYNGDGRADRAIYNSGSWAIDYGFNGTADAFHQFGGLAGDVALAGDFDGDWRADNVIYRAGVWFVDHGNDSTIDRTFNYGGPDDRPLFGPVNPASSLFVRAGVIGGNGSQATPYGTINQALPVAAPGTIIRIAAGNYPENVWVFQRQDLTFLGTGTKATHLKGGSATAPPFSPTDAVTVAESQTIAFRNLHVKSPDQRGVINLGSSLTLDHVSTLKNSGHHVIAVRSGANAATLLIESSILNKSKTGNGLRLEGGVAATVRRTSIDRNGRQLTDPVPTINGRGVEAFDDSQLTLEHSSVSQNYDGGLLIVQTSSAIIRNSTISLNGINGIFFLGSPSAEIHGNFILGNGTKGARGAATGYNGIEVADGWTGPQMLIHENSIFDSTAGGIYIGGSAVNVNVADNHFYNNFLGVTIANPANVTLQGNLFELPAVQGAEEGILIVGPGPVVTVGGAGPNTFTNYLNAGGASPAIHCGGSVTVSCPAGGNVWQNVDLRVLDCPATCSSAP